MYNEKKWNLVPLKMIRIAKNMSTEEMASHFEVTTAYINLIENGDKALRKTTLKYGLIGLNISYEDYSELENFSNYLLEKEIDKHDKYKYMLMKTIGILSPEERIIIEEYLNNALDSKTK